MCVYSLGIVALESVVLVSGSGTVAAEDGRVVDESVKLGLAIVAAAAKVVVVSVGLVLISMGLVAGVVVVSTVLLLLLPTGWLR